MLNVCKTSHKSQKNSFCAFIPQYPLQVLVATDWTLQDQAATRHLLNKNLNGWSYHFTGKLQWQNLTFNELNASALQVDTQARKQHEKNLPFYFNIEQQPTR